VKQTVSVPDLKKLVKKSGEFLKVIIGRKVKLEIL